MTVTELPAERPASPLAGPDDEPHPGCYAELGRLLRRYLRGRVPDADIDDVVQASLLDVWRYRARFDPGRSLTAWVLTIARRRAVDHLRSRRHEVVSLDDDAALPGVDGRSVACRVEQAHDVQNALAALPSPQRQAIEMAYYSDLTQREIAQRLDVPLGTIKARTSRGLRRLESLIGSPAG